MITKFMSGGFVAASLLLGQTALSKAGDIDPAAVQRAMKRGTTMFWFDRAAWVSSDDLASRLSAERLSEIGGWIVTPFERGYHVDYFGKGQAEQQVIYSTDVDGRTLSQQMIYPASGGPVLKGTAAQMAHALSLARDELAKRTDWQPCTPANFNTIVLPPDDDGTVSVYFLTPQTESDSFPFGGHYEIDIATDGHVTSARAFTRACITVKKEAQAGSKPAALFLTHILDPQPTEIHVFEQFGTGVPLYVGIAAPRSVWKIENGQVGQVDKAKEAAAMDGQL